MRYDMTLGWTLYSLQQAFAQKSRPYKMTSFCKGPLECRLPLQNKVCGIALQDSGATWLSTNFRQLLGSGYTQRRWSLISWMGCRTWGHTIERIPFLFEYISVTFELYLQNERSTSASDGRTMILYVCMAPWRIMFPQGPKKLLFR